MASVTTSTLTRKVRKYVPAKRDWYLDRIPNVSRMGLRIGMGGEHTLYWLTPIASDFGEAFRLEKFIMHGGETYNILLDKETGNHTCECMGFLRHGKCKHLNTLLDAKACGQL